VTVPGVRFAGVSLGTLVELEVIVGVVAVMATVGVLVSSARFAGSVASFAIDRAASAAVAAMPATTAPAIHRMGRGFGFVMGNRLARHRLRPR
jgi:hypothetical protein